jgi:bifunctional DNase/RNase
MIEMVVKGLAVEAESRQPVVILTDREEKHFLPIWIGFSEADSILLALEKIAVPRPGTHDLLKTVLDTASLQLERVAVVELQDKVFYARLIFAEGQDKPGAEIDCRPSDAIALALRAGAPIFVSESVMAQASILDKGKYEKEMADFRKFLDQVKPSDFSKYDDVHKPWHPPEEPGEGKEEGKDR